MSKPLLILIVSAVHIRGCYWNHPYPYEFFGTKTPYETVRGDIRDYRTGRNCEAVSLWILSRHGNRYPGARMIARMKEAVLLKEKIFDGYIDGTSKLCIQDIENLKRWTWNKTIEQNQNELTDTGYNEMFNIGKRIRHRYDHLLHGTAEQFYFRSSNQRKSIMSCKAFVKGLTDGLSLNVTIEDPWAIDEVLRPYEKCDRYQKEVKEGSLLPDQLRMYFLTPAFKDVQSQVQKRLGLRGRLNEMTVFSMYDICRFYRSWTENLRDPWCAFFSDDDLMMLEYYDDIRHYYKNGYGYRINVDLGQAPLKDLFANFEAVVNGEGKKIVSYFTDDIILEMAWCALGLHGDTYVLSSVDINPRRQWRTSFFGAFSANMIAVLNKCNQAENITYTVQIFSNEKVIPVCPPKGCPWNKFQSIFQMFNKMDLGFCSLGYVYTAEE